MNYGQRLVTCTGDRNQDHPHGKEMQNIKMVVCGGLINSCERREVKSKGEKERYTHLNAECQRERRKPSSVMSAKK